MLQLAALRALPWKLIGFCGLAMAMVLMFAALRMEQAQNVKLKAQLSKCADAKNEQKPITKGNVTKAKEADKTAKRVSERINAAPTVPQCGTPPEIMGADL